VCKDSDSEFEQYKLEWGDPEDVSIGECAGDLRTKYLAAKLATERERCKLLEIRVQTAMGRLIPAEEMKNAMFAKGRIIRDGILNIPDRIAPLLLNKNDVPEIHGILMRELCEVLKELSQDDWED
jgi:hypothetical protein